MPISGALFYVPCLESYWQIPSTPAELQLLSSHCVLLGFCSLCGLERRFQNQRSVDCGSPVFPSFIDQSSVLHIIQYMKKVVLYILCRFLVYNKRSSLVPVLCLKGEILVKLFLALVLKNLI